MNKNLTLIISTFTIVGAIYGGLWTLDTRYVLAAQQTQFNVKTKLEIALIKLKDSYRDLSGDYYFNRDLLRKYPDDAELKQKTEDQKKEMLKLEGQMQKLQEKLNEGTSVNQ